MTDGRETQTLKGVGVTAYLYVIFGGSIRKASIHLDFTFQEHSTGENFVTSVSSVGLEPQERVQMTAVSAERPRSPQAQERQPFVQFYLRLCCSG